MTEQEFREQVNEWGGAGRAFFFLIDFEQEKPWACPLDEAAFLGVFYDWKNLGSNLVFFKEQNLAGGQPSSLIPLLEQREAYGTSFDIVMEHILEGHSYLLNLTQQTPVAVSKGFDLRAIFCRAQAPYKLWIKREEVEFVCFSPEAFVRLSEGEIRTFPMKGTRKAESEQDAEALLLDEKELFEHYTIVDLMRNDLSQVSSHVRVERFRYLEKIETQGGVLYQTSSEIVGDLPEKWRASLGDILWRLLPAGSISGAPKKKTLEIIREAEAGKRGYYTGVAGIFDGKSLESAVCIRFIEKTAEGYAYRSGGGITFLSENEKEYEELREKIYLPFA